jgi:serine/threonine protein kinase
VAWFDCKPGNILLDRPIRRWGDSPPKAKIADVGLSRMLAGTRTETMLVRPLRFRVLARASTHAARTHPDLPASIAVINSDPMSVIIFLPDGPHICIRCCQQR